MCIPCLPVQHAGGVTRSPCPVHPRLGRLPLQLPSVYTPLLIQLPASGSSSFEVIRVGATSSAYIGDVKDAIVAKFKQRFSCDQLQLFKLDDKGCCIGEALQPIQTLAEAGLLSATGAPIKLLFRTVMPGV